MKVIKNFNFSVQTVFVSSTTMLIVMNEPSTTTSTAVSANVSGPASDTASMSLPVKKVSKADHITYKQMVVAAVSALRDRKGTSYQAIRSYIKENYPKAEENTSFSSHLRKAVTTATKSGALLQFTGTGANGSFKLPKEVKKAKPKQALVPAKKAAPLPAKKAALVPAKKPASTVRKPTLSAKKAASTSKKSVSGRKKAAIEKSKAGRKTAKKPTGVNKKIAKSKKTPAKSTKRKHTRVRDRKKAASKVSTKKTAPKKPAKSK